ncbi:MAG: tripartite tricarboxylate transporter permease [Stomatobaculum sp.]|nr:tripartite tricarboxylate transporter permease [Stomatobaculum sp.]
MEFFSYAVAALAPSNLLLALLGTVIGIIVGALPGFTPTMGIAVMIPMTYTMKAGPGLIFLGSIYVGAMFGGAITAILINTPGTSAAAASAIDGYPMTKSGKAHEALVEAATSSFWGGILGVLALMYLAPPLAKFAFNFGPQERFMMAIFGLTIIASLSAKSILKGLSMGALGLALACIGMDPVLGKARFTFGSTFMGGGINMIPAVIGLFSLSQVFTSLKNPLKKADGSGLVKIKSSRISLPDLCRYPLSYIRSSVVGIIIGIIPGTGGDVSSYLAYQMGKMMSKHPEEYGNGSREGVGCCQAASSSCTGGTLIPTLTLGVPGNATAAVLLSGLTIHGLTPGYALFTSNQSTTYPFILALFISTVLTWLIGLFGAKYFARVTLIPKEILSGAVLMLSVMGSYAIRSKPQDVIVMIVFGVVGYLLKCYKYDVVPIVLGLILGPIAEQGLAQMLILNKNSLASSMMSLFGRPICIALMLLSAASIAYPLWTNRKEAKKAKEIQEIEED